MLGHTQIVLLWIVFNLVELFCGQQELLEASSTEVLLTATGSFLSFWVCLPMLPDKFTLDPAMRQAWLALPKVSFPDPGMRMASEVDVGRFLAVLLQQMAKPGAEAVLENLYNLLVFHLGNRSALQRFCVGQVMLHLARLQQDQIYPEFLVNKLLECLTDSVYYDEIALDFTRTQKDYQDFIATLRHYKVPLEDDVNFSLTQNHNLSNVPRVQSSLAGALIALKHLPAKLNPLVRPLMDSIKKEKNSTLQRDSSAHLVRLLELCVDRKPSPNAKILRNLITLYCSSEPPHPGHQASNCILTLDHMQKKAELQCFQRRANTVGRPPRIPEGVVLPDEKEQKQLEVQQQGAAATLVQAASHFGPKLLELLPQLGASMLEPILNSGLFALSLISVGTLNSGKHPLGIQ
ncbi:hypothetical protein LAZ67_10001198 [Cordylochernes scorpioides]|uniref:Mot1 central domain-containing protein n=1 Tax=Cordylochernes scorpioides TaxID=51811 RepID=A0ABY6KVP9_9ARAC|nr:hypothetical protein LAZ67_10001198 [Cordylochernes scorpioides]